MFGFGPWHTALAGDADNSEEGDEMSGTPNYRGMSVLRDFLSSGLILVIAVTVIILAFKLMGA